MTGPDDLIRRGDVLRIFEPETSMVRRRICDDVRAIPSVSIAAPSEVQAERDAALAGAVKVSPLVWKKEPRKTWTAEDYIINDARNSELYRGFIWGRIAQGWCDPVPTLEAAKAAAQADYEARILASIQPDTDSLQKRANDWALACFGAESLMDKTERTHRFVEEALELAQACDCTKGEALQLVDYVFARDKGDVPREVGDVINTIALLCTAHGIDMDDAGHKGLDWCWENIEKTRAKRAAKPSFSPLPVDTEAVEMAEAAAFSAGFEAGERSEREACAVLASVRADSLDDAIKWGGGKVYLASLKGGLIELRNLAAAIRKRGEEAE